MVLLIIREYFHNFRKHYRLQASPETALPSSTVHPENYAKRCRQSIVEAKDRMVLIAEVCYTFLLAENLPLKNNTFNFGGAEDVMCS